MIATITVINLEKDTEERGGHRHLVDVGCPRI